MKATIYTEKLAVKKENNYTMKKLEEILAYLETHNLKNTSPYHQFKELYLLNCHSSQSNSCQQS